VPRRRSPFDGDPGGIIDPTSGRIIRGTESWNIYCPLGCPHPWEWRPVFPWEAGFDPGDPHWQDRGWRFVHFVETFCVHTKDPWRGMPFILMPFQLALGLLIFGTVDEEGFRIIRTAYIEWARKSGKSEFAAAVVCYFLFADGVWGGEIYGAAKDQDQAALILAVVADMVELSPELKARAKVTRSTHRILNRKTGTFYYAIPADEAGAHGFNATVVIGDEIHTWPTRER
jgi:phage terminase large subunit-like protein